MIDRIARIWLKPLVHWTLFDLVAALVLISLASIASGAVLGAAAVIPAVVRAERRKTSPRR